MRHWASDPCRAQWCQAHAIRRPSCRYHETGDDDTHEQFVLGEVPHENAAPLCEYHVSKCRYCPMAVCGVHNDADYCFLVDVRVRECGNCSRACCTLHSVQCAYDCAYDCIKCGGLDSDDEGSDWRREYVDDYLCKHHRMMDHVEAGVPLPDSPDGEPMTEATKRRLRRNK